VGPTLLPTDAIRDYLRQLLDEGVQHPADSALRYGRGAATGAGSLLDLLSTWGRPMQGGSHIEDFLKENLPGLGESHMEGLGSVLGLPVGTTLTALAKGAPLLAALGAIKKVEGAGSVASDVTRAKRVVGTTGQYVGAPPGVDSPSAFRAVIDRYLKAIERGIPGRKFYEESSADVIARTGGDTQLADSVVGNLAVTSRKQSVGGNTAIGVRGHTQMMTGQPVQGVGLPGNAEDLAAQYAGGTGYLGHKREPFAEQLSVKWAPERVGRGVNDMHEAEIMGFPPDATLSATNHAFMDEVRDRAIKIANARKIGGFDDWGTGTAQAAAWTGNKIRRGEVKAGDAAKTYAYYLPRAEANATYETLPGLGIGHLPGSATAPFAEKQAFHDDPRGNWTNEHGRDLLYTKAGLLPGPDVAGVGRFGQEVNPATVARPVVAMDVGGADVASYSKDALNAVEAFRAYNDAQNAGAWHKIVGSKAPQYDIAGLEVPGMSEEVMKTLAPLIEQKGYGVASAPHGMSVMSFGDAPKGAAFAKDVRGFTKSQGLEKPEMGKMAPGRLAADYESLWQHPEGSGSVTRAMLENLEKSPEVAARLDDPAIRAAVGAKNERDLAFSQWGAPRDDVHLARKIFSEEGFEGLKKALAAGALLPAAVIAAFGLSSQEQTPQQ
jgi:hypothetical protein